MDRDKRIKEESLAMSKQKCDEFISDCAKTINHSVRLMMMKETW